MRRGASAGSSFPLAASTTTAPWPFARAASIPVLIAAPTPRRRPWEMTRAPASRASSGPPSSDPSSTTIVSAIVGGTRRTSAAIACGEVAVALVVPGRAVAGAQPTELVEHPLRDGGVDEREPVGHGSDRVGELAAGDLLQEVARRPGADRAEDELVLVVVREHDHA